MTCRAQAAALGPILLVALAGACVETVGITMELRYDPAMCGGCSPTAATLPSNSTFSLAISDAETEEVLEPRCFQSNSTLTIAELPAAFRESEFNRINLPGDRRLVARLDIYPPTTSCTDRTGPALLTASSAATVLDDSPRFVLIVDCPGGALCSL